MQPPDPDARPPRPVADVPPAAPADGVGRAEALAAGVVGAPRPRPVADVPPAALADGVMVARGWLLGLIAGRALEDAAGVPVGALAGEGPAVAAAVLRAVGSDAGLTPVRALGPDAARLAGARDAAAAAAAIAALRDAAWAALSAAVPVADAHEATALARRLAHVADALLAGALAGAPSATLTARRLRGAAPWRGALEPALATGEPLALVAVEVAGVEELLRAGAQSEVARAEAAIREVAPAAVRERTGRLWVVLPGGDVAAGSALAERAGMAVAAAATHRGVPLRVCAGVAASPQDGTDAEALAAAAEQRALAAAAAGVIVG
jgi:hypothetical protein